MKIEIGQKAPLFTLYDTDKKQVSLSDFKDKNVVLLFFPLAFTSVCTTELAAMRDAVPAYNKLNAQIISISVDSLFTLAKFKETQQHNFPLLSDFNKEVSSGYGALYTEYIYGMKGVSKRAAFVIDKVGIIRYAEVLEKANDLPDFTAINEVLLKLQEPVLA